MDDILFLVDKKTKKIKEKNMILLIMIMRHDQLRVA